MNGNTSCSLLEALSQLRQSSLESIDSASNYTENSEYMHIARPIEEDIRTLLRKVNASDKKSLIILTGSAGDGKSHLLSFLKNKDPEHLLDNYIIINDATESDHPTETAIQRLAKVLEPFSDQNLPMGNPSPIILAINLGMLNNFINSSYGKKFSALKDYLDKIDVFTGSVSDSYNPDSFFQTINFSDYQFFSLKEGTYDDSDLLKIFTKITADTPENPFFQAYKKCNSCSQNSKCPVMANFTLFCKPEVQKVVAFRIVQSVIEEKCILTMREIQNFIYEILVSPDFSAFSNVDLNQPKEVTLQKYLHATLPFLLYKGQSPSSLVTSIRKHDPLGIRKQNQDDMLIRLYSTNNLEPYADRISQSTPYQLFNVVNKDYWENLRGEIRSVFIDFMLLLNYAQKLEIESNFTEYLTYLYNYYLGKTTARKGKKMAPLINLTTRAIQKWYGDFEKDDQMCLDLSLRKFWILEK